MPLLPPVSPLPSFSSARSPSFRSRSCRIAATLLAVATLAACTGASKRVVYDPEEFDSTTTHARSYGASEAQTCEAARRALLSQGYLLSAANIELVTGRKSFQPATEVHVEVEFRVVCAKDSASGTAKGATRRTIAFVTALQDRYGIKKINNSASVGVGAFGSLSVPFSSSDDAMVKVASETLTDERFYDRFFALLDRFLVTGAAGDAVEEPVIATPVVPASPMRSAPVAPIAPVAPVEPPAPTPVAPSPTRG
ncbi:MAG: DUF2242 domain-containing protein [Janthinobacterium lividum]